MENDRNFSSAIITPGEASPLIDENPTLDKKSKFNLIKV